MPRQLRRRIYVSAHGTVSDVTRAETQGARAAHRHGGIPTRLGQYSVSTGTANM